jgi:predicted porin
VAWEAGGSYTYGPLVVGAHFYQYFSAGLSGPVLNPDGTPTGTPQSVGGMRETGFSAGATYSVAPGFALNLTYIWGERASNGYDFLTGETSYPTAGNATGCGAISATATSACLHNKVTTSGIMLGAQLTW